MVLPIDSWVARLLRPFIVIALVAVLYLVFTVLVSRFAGEWYRKVRHLLPLAAFNTLAVGVVLLFNYQVKLDFLPALGLAAGAVVGFVVITALTVEGVSRVDNPDTPAAFRGLPVTFVYLGLLALALMGFEPVVNFI
jgi:Na+-translocating ferredoxin:NAD+ oxidoreductase RnfA subunit